MDPLRLSTRAPRLLRALFMVLALAAGCDRPSPQTVTLPTGGSSPEETTASSAPAPAAPPPAAPAPAALPTPPGTPAGDLVAAGNLDGDGDDEIILWSQGRLSMWAKGEQGLYEVFSQASPEEGKIPGAPRQLEVTDLDGDGREDLLLGFGMTRGQLDVPVTLALLRLKGQSGSHKRVLTTLYQARSSRPEITGIDVGDLDGNGLPEVLLSHFDSKYFVSSFVLSLLPGKDPVAGPLPFKPLNRVRMATSWAVGNVAGDKRLEVIAGRPYGEEKLAPGDLLVLEGEAREKIPSELGVRSVTVGDGDGDGRLEVYFGDGWHYDYGKVARGRLSVARKGPQGWKSELLEETKGQYEIKRIEIADVDGDKKPEVVAAGNEYINLYWKTPKGWMVRKVADGDDFAIARLGGVQTLVVPGNPVRLVPLAAGREGGRPVEGGPTSKP